MNALLIVVIVISILIVMVNVFLLYMGFKFRRQRSACESTESRFCYTIACPCDDKNSGPCNGYAIRKTADGNFNCSYNSAVKVNLKGEPV